MSDPEGVADLYRPKQNFRPMLDSIGQQYPALAPHLKQFEVQWGDPSKNPGGGSVEFYPPHEAYNPNPGKPTVELFDGTLAGPALQKSVFGDSLHHLGGEDERGQPVDPHFYGMKQDLLKSLTPSQLAVDQKAHARAGESRPFDDWMQQSRGDAYIRGALAPDARDEWRDAYTPEQRRTLSDMFLYLKAAPL